MNSKFVAVCLMLACVCGVAQVSGAGSTCEVLSTTTRIIKQLCYANNGANKNNETVIDEFFGCYDTAITAGKPQFVKCQTDVWGGPLDNTKAVSASCTNQLKLLPYSLCLRREFKNAGLDMTSTVLALNICQYKALGIN